MRQMLDWWMVKQLEKLKKDELRYVSMECGALYVTTVGMLEMLQWCVDNWATTLVSLTF